MTHDDDPHPNPLSLPRVTDEDITVIAARWRPIVALIQANAPPEQFMDALAHVPYQDGAGALIQAVLDIGTCIGKIMQLQEEMTVTPPASRSAPSPRQAAHRAHKKGR